jgi:phosphopantetheine adenylyltransferase/dephospho-CoA kinase
LQNIDGKPIRPYIIGLTGGIASGKSSIAEKIEKFGAGLINCDLVAHSLYAPGMKCYNLIAETFGSAYLTSDGQIDRKALGNLVFNDEVCKY